MAGRGDKLLTIKICGRLPFLFIFSSLLLQGGTVKLCVSQGVSMRQEREKFAFLGWDLSGSSPVRVSNCFTRLALSENIPIVNYCIF